MEQLEATQYKVEVLAHNEQEYVGNQLTFNTLEQAKKYGSDLFDRWMALDQWRVVELPSSNIVFESNY